MIGIGCKAKIIKIINAKRMLQTNDGLVADDVFFIPFGDVLLLVCLLAECR